MLFSNWSPQGPSHMAPGIEMKRRQRMAWARISICGCEAASKRFRARAWTLLSSSRSAFALSSVSSWSGRGMGPDDKAKAQGRRLNNSAAQQQPAEHPNDAARREDEHLQALDGDAKHGRFAFPKCFVASVVH